MKMVQLVCLTCGKEFSVYWKREKTAKYCSYHCAGKTRAKKTINGKCAVCGKEFTHEVLHCVKPTKYCSHKCQQIDSVKRQREKMRGICLNCNKPFGYRTRPERPNIFCSRKCYNEYKHNHPTWNSVNSHKRGFHIRGWINKCSDCGYDTHPEILQIHHLNGRSDHTLEKIIVLCPNCHALKHRLLPS